MQVTAQAAALLLTGEDQPLPGMLQRSRQRHPVGGDTGLPGQILQQPVIGRREPLVAAASSQHQLTDRLTPVVEREP